MIASHTSDLNVKILSILRDMPGIKAREIASELGVEKELVNKALYGSLSDKCMQDNKYCWYLNNDFPVSTVKEDDTALGTPLAKISNYYLACLGQDVGEGIRVFADGKDLDYTELVSFPSSDNDYLQHTGGVQNLLSKIRRDRGNKEVYFGYPTVLKYVKSRRSSWEGFFVEPVFIFSAEVNRGTLRITDTFPMLNFSVLKLFTNAEREQLMDEFVQLEEELGIDFGEDLPEFDDLVRRLVNIRPEWPWMEDIVPDKLITEPPIRELQEEGIYNRAIFIIGERSPYTRGLEAELKSLSKLEPSIYKDTVLGQWVSGDLLKQSESDTEDKPILEILPLNTEQRQAIQSSLDAPLTVITGPPGTGKSQVVTNLLVNAVWRGKKILFASKNNKAVDVVETRVNNLAPRPVLLRMGAGQYHVRLAEYLIGLLTTSSSVYDSQEFEFDKQRYRNLEKRFTRLSKYEDRLVELRNKIDELDQIITNRQKYFSPDLVERLNNIDPMYIRMVADDLYTLIQHLQNRHGILGMLRWALVGRKCYQDFWKEFHNLASDLEIFTSKMDVSYSIQSWSDLHQKLTEYYKFAQVLHEYADILTELKNTKSLEQIAKERLSLLKDMASIAKDIWIGWLNLQPSRLSDEDRNLLGNYHTMLKMIIETGGDIYKKLGRKIYREYSALSKQVSHLLPAWAVTSLSARGKVPFEAGYFDIVVFDEASQCDIASALPLLYRAKQAVVIGDPKQLCHISGLKKGQDQQLLEKYGLVPEYVRWAYSYNSLFDLACGFASQDSIINLRDHHRSHKDIIEFANKGFYENKLRVATDYSCLKPIDSNKRGVQWINVKGEVVRPKTGGAVNEEEARCVVKEIDRLINEKKYNGTIGIVTPFRGQANFIRRIIGDCNGLQDKLLEHDFIVDTVHKFQGDERDVIIFSPVISNNMPVGALAFLENNGNLFNVAITRARATLLVVGDLESIIKCKVSYLERFAKYVKNLETMSTSGVENRIQDLGEKYPTVANPDRVSKWERVLYSALYKAGIKTIPQYQVEKYTLDLALFSNERRLDIEVDGERYHRNWTGELCRRDQIRNQRLFELGWDVKRFWVYEIRDNIDDCVAQIKKWQECS